MALFTQEVPEGLRFDNEEAAISFFKSTLLEETPLGDLYDKIHSHDWKGYDIQATGDKNSFVSATLSKGNLEDSIFKRVMFNVAVDNEELIDADKLIEELEIYIKAVDVAEIPVTEAIAEVIENKDGKFGYRNLDLENVSTTLVIESTTTNDVMMNITFAQGEPQFSIGGTVKLDDQGRVDLEEVRNLVYSMFLNKIEGVLTRQDVYKAGDYPIDFIIDYATYENKKIRFEILEDDIVENKE